MKIEYKGYKYCKLYFLGANYLYLWIIFWCNRFWQIFGLAVWVNFNVEQVPGVILLFDPLQWCESGWEGGCYSVQCDHYTCDQHCAMCMHALHTSIQCSMFNVQCSLHWCELSGWEGGGGNSSLFLRRLCPAVHTDKTLGGKGEWFEYLKCLHHNHRFNHRTKHG